VANAVSKLFESLANAALDRALPTVTDRLRDRVGPSATVGRIIADGAFVHLDAVSVPIGPRRGVVLERATLRIDVGAAGKLGLPGRGCMRSAASSSSARTRFAATSRSTLPP